MNHREPVGNVLLRCRDRAPQQAARGGRQGDRRRGRGDRRGLADGRRLFAFGCSHSSLPVQDIVYRAGELMLVNPIYGPGIVALDTRPTTLGSDIERLPGYAEAILDNSPLEPGDVLIVVSVFGRNAVPVEMARLAAEHGATAVGVTSHAYSDAVTSRIPRERK